MNTNPIREARDLRPGDWIMPTGEQYPREIARVTRCQPREDLWTGERHMIAVRVYFDDRRDGQARFEEHRLDAMVSVY